jgi:hypothetical protein
MVRVADELIDLQELFSRAALDDVDVGVTRGVANDARLALAAGLERR